MSSMGNTSSGLGSTGGLSVSIDAGSLGPGPGVSTDDPAVTGARGRVDDMTRHLASIRGQINLVNAQEISAHLDDADAAIEAALDTLLPHE